MTSWSVARYSIQLSYRRAQCPLVKNKTPQYDLLCLCFEQEVFTKMINWKEIWQTHAPFFKDGISKIPLGDNKFIKLAPGAGFGDLSHPTTSLCLTLLSQNISFGNCVDIGTGSGILAIAAAMQGAKKVFAYEIDPESIEHAKENIALNGLSDVITLNPPDNPSQFDLLLLNMISGEQKVALDAYHFANQCNHTRIISGVLAEQDIAYRKNFSNGVLKEKRQKGEWMAYNFSF